MKTLNPVLHGSSVFMCEARFLIIAKSSRLESAATEDSALPLCSFNPILVGVGAGCRHIDEVDVTCGHSYEMFSLAICNAAHSF